MDVAAALDPPLLNPISTNVAILKPLKTSENLGFSDVFRGYASRTLVENGLKQSLGLNQSI